MNRVVLFFSAMLCCISAFAAPKSVAVYVEGELSKADKSIVSSAIVSRLSGNKEFKAYERNTAFTNALDKEHDYQLSGEVAEKEIRGVGQRFGVDFVIVLNVVISSDDRCHMSARLVQLTTGEIIKSVNLQRDYTGISVLSTMANNVAYRLLNSKSK